MSISNYFILTTDKEVAPYEHMKFPFKKYGLNIQIYKHPSVTICVDKSRFKPLVVNET